MIEKQTLPSETIQELKGGGKKKDGDSSRPGQSGPCFKIKRDKQQDVTDIAYIQCSDHQWLNSIWNGLRLMVHEALPLIEEEGSSHNRSIFWLSSPSDSGP